MQVLLNDFSKAVQFNKICNKYEGDIDLSINHIILDAKSITGIFSLDLSKPLKVDFRFVDPRVENKFCCEMAKFRI